MIAFKRIIEFKTKLTGITKITVNLTRKDLHSFDIYADRLEFEFSMKMNSLIR